MTVEQLIEKLSEMDPSANVMLDGPKETVCFSCRDAIDDDNGRFVILLRGDEVPVTVEP